MGSAQKTRIGVYCPGVGTGGPWRYVHSILGGLDPDEFEVSLFCDLAGAYEACSAVRVVPIQAKSPSRKLARGSRVISGLRNVGKVHKRWVPTFARVWGGLARETRRLARLIRQHPVDLFHTQNTGCEESAVAARLAGTRRVMGTFHVDSTYDLHRVRSGPSHRVLEQISNGCLDVAIAVSHATGGDWIRRTHMAARRVLTIHNGINPERFCRRVGRSVARERLGLPPEGRLIIGGVGRLEEAKGFAGLLDAVSLLVPKHPQLLLAIAGEGPLRPFLLERAEAVGLGRHVCMIGFQEDVQLVYDALDIFVLPSLCEALPYALLEAMATELPAVGTRVGGIPEVVAHGETGFVVPAREPQRLAGALATLINSPDLRARMGNAGRDRVVRSFNENDMIRKTVQVYRTLSQFPARRPVSQGPVRPNDGPRLSAEETGVFVV